MPELVDVFVRYRRKSSPEGSKLMTRGRFGLYQKDVPLSSAFEIAQRLRADPLVDWAYCTEPQAAPKQDGEKVER